MTVHRIQDGRSVLRVAGMTLTEIARHMDTPRRTVYGWYRARNRLFMAWAEERERSAMLRQAAENLAEIRKRMEGQ